MIRFLHFILCLLIVATSSLAAAQPSASVGPIAQPGVAGPDWPVVGGTALAWRYSGLNQINAGNVKQLVPIWSYETGDYEGGLRTTPIAVDGVVYVYTASSHVIALDGATGSLIWQYKFEPPAGVTPSTRTNSGVAIADGKVFLGTRSNYLIALDQRTGEEVWKVANGDVTNGTSGIAGAPLIAGKKVIVGSGGLRGSISAYDIKTGHLAWRFHTIPGKGEKGSKTWPDEEALKYGGGNVWTSGQYDSDLNLTYWGVGDPRPTFYSANRAGDNLYTASILALDVDTGKLRWYYQEVPHDTWDMDASSENTLIDREVGGRMRKLLVNLGKGGFAWVLDRGTGKLIGVYPFADYYNWVKGINQKGELLGRVDPVQGKKTLICPSNLGAKGWQQSAFSPQTGWLYVPVMEFCNDLVTLPPGGGGGEDRGSGSFLMRPIPGHSTGYSHLDALDPLTGKRQWTHPYQYVFLASVLATAGDLILTGDVEGHFIALNARNGEKLWSYQTGAPHRGGAITYSVAGRQIIATPIGNSQSILSELWPDASKWRVASAVVAFALPEETQ
jgi:alcohol dehydrogenase (cytochrome c)